MTSLLSRIAIMIEVLVLVCATICQAADGDVARATLKNGLRVVIVRNSLAPAVAVELNYLVGSVEAPPGFPGMAHAQEHMMFRGSPGLSAQQLSTIMAGMGGENNAGTQQVVTQYTATVAKSDLETVLRVEAVRMAGVLDAADAWKQERGAIEQEVEQDLSNPEYLLYVNLLEKLFAGTPYAYDALGSRSSFDKTTGAMLQKFHRDWYAPNNAVLVIVGDVETGHVLKMVRRLFERVRSRPLPPRPKVELQPLKPAHLDLPSNLPYGVAVLAYRLPGYQSPDYAAGVVLGDVLDSQRGELYALVPEGKALAAEFELLALPAAGAGIATAAFPQGGDGKALLAKMREVIAGYLGKGLPPELVQAAKRHEVAQVEFRKESLQGLAEAWSQAVAVEGRQSPQDDIAAIRRVTVDDVNRVARAYLKNEGAVSALLVPRPSGNPVPAKGFSRGKESFEAQSVKPVRLPSWARRLTTSLPAAAPETKPSEFRLPNGLRVMVVSTASSDTVAVYGEVKNSPYLETPPGKEGVDDILDALFSYGSVTRDRLAFQAALDDIAAEESAGTSFSLRVLKEHFARGVELLSENLLQPALPEPAFRIVQGELAASLAGKLQSPGWLTEFALKKGLYPEHDPKLRHPTPETVRALTLDDVKKYHRLVFRPDLTALVVIGNVTEAEARRVIGEFFGSWRAQGPPPATDLPPVPPNRPAAVTVPDKSRTQAEVTLAETLEVTRLHPDYYPLQVGLRVLSGGFYATRLDRDLRERAGLVYTVEAFAQAEKTRSVFGVFYACDPKNVETARGLVQRNLDQMQRTEVSRAELLQAKTILLRQMLLQRSSAPAIAEQLLNLVRNGLPLDEPAHAARKFGATSAAQVRSVFERWIRPSDLVQVVRGPAPL